jgi:predicted secreted Zn-dependent protease
LKHLLLLLALTLPAQAAEWQAKEIIAHYTVSGTTGIALYQSSVKTGRRFQVGLRAAAARLR